jgi:hypothetical protein
MAKIKLAMGLAVAASLLSFAPVAEAAPVIASPGAVTLPNADSPIVPVVTRAGVAHRSARRTTRRVIRR